MKLLLINSVCGIGSTGRLCVDIAKAYEKEGYEVKIAYGRSAYVPEECYKYAVRIGSNIDTYLHALGTRITDRHGLFSKRATKQFLEWSDEFDPDMVWLHNIHGYYINYEMLFDWIKSRPNLKVRWTLHDCWTFTGHCAYFSYAGCDKWQPEIKRGKEPTACGRCPQKKNYPSSALMDNSIENWIRKKKAFTGVKDLTIITPSVWLKNLVQESFLKEYPIQVIYNKIDLEIFKPTPSDYRQEHGLSKGAFVILGVANVWEKRKGLDDFVELQKRLEDAHKEEMLGKRIQIILIGLSDKQIKKMPKGIIALPRTRSPKELAAAYTAASVVVNPTYEDNYPSVILEAEACGTPVITYDTGGCGEAIHISGSKVIPKGVDNLEKEILRRVL